MILIIVYVYRSSIPEDDSKIDPGLPLLEKVAL